MVILALLIWLAVVHSIVAPWWLWTLWAALWGFDVGMQLYRSHKRSLWII